MKNINKALALLVLAAAVALSSCDGELTDAEKAAKFTYPDKNAETSAQALDVGDTVASGDFTLTVMRQNTACVTSYSGKDAEVAVPMTAEGLTVTAIGEKAFAGNTAVAAVHLPVSVVIIESEAFRGCVNLVEISGTENVETVGAHAFSETGAAAYADSEFVTVGDILIAYKGSGGDITVPDGIRILSSAFAGNGDLTSVSLPRSLEYIGEGAFEACSSLIEVYIPYSVTGFGENVFTGTPANFTVVCTESSPADVYCHENGINRTY